MVRLLMFCSLLSIAACAPDTPTDGSTPETDPALTQKTPEPTTPPTGIPRIQADVDMYSTEIGEIEQALGEDKSPDANQARLLLNLRQGVEHLITAATMGRDIEAKEGARTRHGHLRQRHSALQNDRRLIWREITEIEDLLEKMAKGLEAAPPGFTEPELRDKVADLRREDDKLKVREKEILAGMKKIEDALKLETVPPEGRSLFSDELAVLEKLRERVDALLNRSR